MHNLIKTLGVLAALSCIPATAQEENSAGGKKAPAAKNVDAGDVEKKMIGYWAPNPEAMLKELEKQLGEGAAQALPLIQAMLENMAETGRAFARIQDTALDNLAERMEDGIKRMLESETKLLEVEYELTPEAFRLRQVNDLFAHKLVAYLDSDKCLLFHCRRHMSPDDGMLLVRALAGRLSAILGKVWLQMRVNSRGGLMMQNDLRILIDGLGEPRGAKRRGEARGLCCLFGVRRGVRGIRRTAFLLQETRPTRLKLRGLNCGTIDALKRTG